MTLDRYQELLRSSRCYTIDSVDQLLLLSPKGKLLIEINYFPQDACTEGLEKYAKHKLLVFVYPGSNMHPELKAKQVEADNLIIMSDSESSEHATSYTLFIDEKNEEVNLKVCDFPIIGRTFISDNEVMGIHKKLWKPQSFRTV